MHLESQRTMLSCLPLKKTSHCSGWHAISEVSQRASIRLPVNTDSGERASANATTTRHLPIINFRQNGYEQQRTEDISGPYGTRP